MLRLRGASAISNSLCNRHRNNDHCLATGQVAARCRKGTRVMRAAPARLPRRSAHAPAGGGAGRGLGRGRRRGKGGEREREGEGEQERGRGRQRGRGSGRLLRQPVQVARPAPPGHRCGQVTPGRAGERWGRAKGPRGEGLCLSPCQVRGLLRSKDARGHQRMASFLFAWWVFFPPAPTPFRRPHQEQ